MSCCLVRLSRCFWTIWAPGWVHPSPPDDKAKLGFHVSSKANYTSDASGVIMLRLQVMESWLGTRLCTSVLKADSLLTLPTPL